MALRNSILNDAPTWMACQVVAPSLVPKAPADRVKTDRSDCRARSPAQGRGAHAHPGPHPRKEAVRDLCRARGDMVEDLDRARRGWAPSCCATERSGGVARAGASSMNSGSTPCASTTQPLPPPSPLTEPWSTPGMLLALRGVEADLPYCDKEPYADCVHRLWARGVAGPGGSHPRLRGLRLAARPQSLDLHGFRGSCRYRALQRGANPSRPHHQGRQRPHP